MKVLVERIVIIFLFVLTICVTSLSQDKDRQPTILVTGTAEVQVQPDEVMITLTVTKRNKDLQMAKKEADLSPRKIVDTTRRFDIRPENVRTDYISVDMKYQSIRDPKNRIYDEDGDEIGTRVFIGYEVSTTIRVKLTDITKFEDFFSDILKTGVSEIGGVSFETSRLREHKDKARQMAMRAAFEKATAMAGAINQTIGKAILIIEGTNPASGGSLQNVSANSNYTSGVVSVSEPIATFSPGNIKISAQVTVTFLLN